MNFNRCAACELWSGCFTGLCTRQWPVERAYIHTFHFCRNGCLGGCHGTPTSNYFTATLKQSRCEIDHVTARISLQPLLQYVSHNSTQKSLTSLGTPGLNTALPSSQNSTSTLRKSSQFLSMPPTPSPPPAPLTQNGDTKVTKRFLRVTRRQSYMCIGHCILRGNLSSCRNTFGTQLAQPIVGEHRLSVQWASIFT